MQWFEVELSDQELIVKRPSASSEKNDQIGGDGKMKGALNDEKWKIYEKDEENEEDADEADEAHTHEGTAMNVNFRLEADGEEGDDGAGFTDIIEPVTDDVVVRVADALEMDIVAEEVAAISKWLMPTQMKKLGALDKLVQERRIIWPKEKEKFFTYPCVINCCCKYDHEIGVAFFAFFTAFLCSAAIVYLAVSSILEDWLHSAVILSNWVPDGVVYTTFVLLAFNIPLHLTLAYGVWKQSCTWISPWLTFFGVEFAGLTALCVLYVIEAFSSGHAEVFVVLSLIVAGLGFCLYMWIVVASLSIRYLNHDEFEYYGIPRKPRNMGRRSQRGRDHTIGMEMTTRATMA